MYFEYKDIPPNELHTPNGFIMYIDEQTNLVKLTKRSDNGGGKYNEQHSKVLMETWQIMKKTHKPYKPIYFDPSLKTNPNHFKEFKAWRDLYLKDPPKAKIAPWTNKEKAYYESLKTKRERYKYLVIRSGIRSSVIDIPLDAIANVDENGKLINGEYEELYAIVEANRGMAHLSDGSLTMAEWEIAAGMLGDIKGFSALRVEGFTARTYQKRVLVHQLGVMWEGGYYGKYGSLIDDGTYNNPLRVAQAMNISKTIKPDRFGMYPYIDEIMGVDWIMDFNVVDRAATDGDGRNLWRLDEKIEEGKILDPRDPKTTEQTRKEFREESKKFYLERYDLEISNEWTQEEVDLYLHIMLLEAKIVATIPPQGYPNAPTYYIPEYLDELYEAGKLDKKLNPTIPAIYRESFPQELRDKIEWYAKKHNIKE
ncbi:hypothetical protein XJ32_03085 [Helicobacter bilis]|uniref:Thioredoxin reductase n=1 Tax=Helicobacter bilis TaxID=37372 RepID=A0A1Q2LFQ5_9HELI|nr:hypothetical protein [Helicobacter bilis]AQQ59250.1 hypothetical protein XJ32_03085 [Helicobacter bilis]